VPTALRDSLQRVCALPEAAAWIAAPLAEKPFVDVEKPCRLRRP
jgi:hypothetical protein